MKKIVTGIVIGMVLSFSASALAGPIKQYLLTEVNYPVVVNGKEYKDANSPILSYQGSTYIPLAKIGELTGVQYKWNDEKKRVEIGASEVTGGALTGATILPSTDYEVVEAPNPYGYKKLMDADDTELVIAKMENTALPPKLSEGWINEELIRKASYYSVSFKGKDKSTIVIGVTFATDPKEKEKWTFNVPSDFATSESGSTEVNGVKMKKYKGFIYFNIEDLETIGVLSK
ncbi:hypothetical protein ABH14_10045 [Brevibacillus brevis]|uniref:stalk domain-containing protein n=1 Tax=Brevibacillus brevis TaxID=1393 RepID=UPI00190240BF|nr:stalk domain-containing protein [Brevibacillus brevis]MBH0330131.1 hypothetical protein [Brevibacillus brevis]